MLVKHNISKGTAEPNAGAKLHRVTHHDTIVMIIGFQHKGIEGLYKTGSTRGVQSAHAAKLQRILALLDVAASPNDLNIPSFKLHQLRGNLNGHWSIRVNGNWRVTFRFEGVDVELVNYLDYH